MVPIMRVRIKNFIEAPPSIKREMSTRKVVREVFIDLP